MGLPATKRTNLHEKYGASANAGNVSACRATGFQSKAHQSARKVRLPQSLRDPGAVRDILARAERSALSLEAA